MEHINRFTLTSLPVKKREREKKKSEIRKKPPLTLRHNDCLFHRCHLSTTACFTAYKRGGGGGGEAGEAGVGRAMMNWVFSRIISGVQNYLFLISISGGGPCFSQRGGVETLDLVSMINNHRSKSPVLKY